MIPLKSVSKEEDRVERVRCQDLDAARAIHEVRVRDRSMSMRTPRAITRDTWELPGLPGTSDREFMRFDRGGVISAVYGGPEPYGCPGDKCLSEASLAEFERDGLQRALRHAFPLAGSDIYHPLFQHQDGKPRPLLAVKVVYDKRVARVAQNPSPREARSWTTKRCCLLLMGSSSGGGRGERLRRGGLAD